MLCDHSCRSSSDHSCRSSSSSSSNHKFSAKHKENKAIPVDFEKEKLRVHRCQKFSQKTLNRNTVFVII